MAAYTPTTWINDTPPPLSAANLNKLTDELESQAADMSIAHSLPTWTDGAAPALTDPVPLNEIERVTQLVAQSVSLAYTKTTWAQGWSPARNATNLNKLEVQAQASRAAIDNVPPPPPPGTYTYRMATFSTSADIIKGCTNRFQPVQSWWVPGQPDGTPWPNNGGLWEITTPHGPGFKMCLVPEMRYPAANPDSQECNFNAYPAEIGPALGATHVWEWTEFWPSGSENPAGQLTDGTWVAGEGVNFAMSSPFGNTVGHHLFMDYSSSHGGIGWRFGRQTYSSANTWTWTQYPQPFLPDTYYHHKWEAKWSASSTGYFRVTTTKQGGSPLQWVNFSGATLPSGWNIWKYMFTYRLQGPLNRHQTKHLINMRVTVT